MLGRSEDGEGYWRVERDYGISTHGPEGPDIANDGGCVVFLVELVGETEGECGESSADSIAAQPGRRLWAWAWCGREGALGDEAQGRVWEGGCSANATGARRKSCEHQQRGGEVVGTRRRAEKKKRIKY